MYYVEIVGPIALGISQIDSPLPGPMDVIAGGLIGIAWMADNFPEEEAPEEKPAPTAINPPNGCPQNSPPQVNDDKPGAGKSDPHGDNGRALEKAEKQIKELKAKLEGASKKEKQKIQRKINNIMKAAQKKRTGETHWR